MTRAYVRIKRAIRNDAGELLSPLYWNNVEIDQLTDEELEGFLTEENGRKWAIFLAKWIRDHVNEE